MNREEKSSFIKTFADNYKGSDAVFMVGVAGLTVAQTQELRAKLRGCGAKLLIGKVRLMKIAIKSADGDNAFVDTLGNQIGAIFVSKDAQTAAKGLVDFNKKVEVATILSGVFKNKLIDTNKIKQLAAIPPYPVLIAQLAGTLIAPIAALARAINEVQKKLAIQ